MERLRNWIDKLRRPKVDEPQPRADTFNPTQEEVDERKRELLEKDEANDKPESGHYDPP